MALKTFRIPFAETGQFSKLFTDYINSAEQLSPFYSYPPAIHAFAQAIADKKKENINRGLLAGVLESQYRNIDSRPLRLELLQNENTFTVCTGHQLCLFTGPLYFIYKIITTINLAEALQKQYPEYNFLPVYWMAGEDHDFEEIRSIHLFGKTLSWNNENAKGAVGRLATDSLGPVVDELAQILGVSANAAELTALFTQAYLKHSNMADATRYIVHELFGAYGLIVLDADDARLKSEFTGIMKDDISNQTNYKLVTKAITQLEACGYEAQVNPRGINVFKLAGNERVRIEQAGADVLDLQPEEYSPNVVLRPLYQQKILPNLAYVGGPGELAYWLEYKPMFDHHKIAFPVLIPRNFALLSDEKTELQMQKLGLVPADLFKDTDALLRAYVSRNAGTELSLNEEEQQLSAVYAGISAKAAAVDITLKGSVEAELQKALNALKNIESKLIRSEKQKQETGIGQLKKIKDKFFPEGTLQERYDTLAPYYIRSGKQLISGLKEVFDPFDQRMMIVTLNG